MGTKRVQISGENDDSELGSIHSRPSKRARPKSRSQSFPSNASLSSINPIKGKIRDVRRLLDRLDNLPAGVRIEKERALAGYRQDLDEAETEKRRQQMIKKYHMVRFFERQKATRNLKKLQTRLSTTTDDHVDYGQLRIEAHDAEVDVNYTLYHPLGEKYQSLYPRSKKHGAGKQDISDSKIEENARTSRPPLWKVVEQCMEQGTLEALKNGRLGRNLIGGMLEQPILAKGQHVQLSKQSNGRIEGVNMTREAASRDRDGDSDGGFFEE